MTKRPSIILIGAGNMGGALLRGWTTAASINFSTSAVIDPSPSDDVLALCEQFGIAVNPLRDETPYDICVIGVKPNLIPEVLPGLHWPQVDKTTFVSIAAGVSLSSLEMLLAPTVPAPFVTRAMPNLPTSVGKGMTLIASNAATSPPSLACVKALFDGVGQAVVVDDEKKLDRWIGFTGSAPGFLFHVVEAFEAAAMTQGASSAEAKLLAKQALIGSAYLLEASDADASHLRDAVTSKGGTTKAGLDKLMLDTPTLTDLIDRAVTAAADRAEVLSK